MIRMLFVAGIAALGIATVAAQENAAEERHALMETQGNFTYNVLGGMARGRLPYDQAKVDEAFAQLAETSAKIPSLFPESSKGKTAAGSNYFTRDALWENKADVEARAAKLVKDVAELRSKVRSLEDLKAVYPTLARECSNCHRLYRGRKS